MRAVTTIIAGFAISLLAGCGGGGDGFGWHGDVYLGRRHAQCHLAESTCGGGRHFRSLLRQRRCDAQHPGDIQLPLYPSHGNERLSHRALALATRLWSLLPLEQE